MALDQDTVDAGIDPYAPQIAKRQKRAASLEGDVERLGKKGEVLAGEEAKLFEERGAARKPTFQALEEKLKTRPSAQVSEEHVPDFQRPKGNGKELEQGMSALAVAAMLVGVATRQPFYGMAQAMNGFMKGYMDADEKVVHESMQTYDKNLNAIKERNAAKRRAVEATLKDYDNDLLGMQQQLKIIAAQYDDQILSKHTLYGSITDQRNGALKQLSVEGNAIDHLIVASESMKLRWASRAAQAAKRSAGAGRGVAPTGQDRLTAFQILKSDPRASKMDDEMRTSLAAEVASRAKSLVVANEVGDFAAGVDMAMDDLEKEGLLKAGKEQPWYRPNTKPTFQRPDPGAPPSGMTGPRGEADDLEKQARDAIVNGKDPSAVAQRYKEMTGKDLGGV